MANDLLRSDSMNADAMYVRGLCLYYEDFVDKAFTHFQQVLRLAPDHQRAKATYKVRFLLKTRICRDEYSVENLKLNRQHHKNCKTHPKWKKKSLYFSITKELVRYQKTRLFFAIIFQWFP